MNEWKSLLTAFADGAMPTNDGKKTCVVSEYVQRANTVYQIDVKNVESRQGHWDKAKQGDIVPWIIELSESCERPDEIISQIASRKSGFFELLDRQIQPELLFHILKILSLCTKSSLKKTLIDVLAHVDHTFVYRLNAAIGEISVKSQVYSDIWGDQKTLFTVCTMILDIVTALVQTFNSALGKCKSVITLVKSISKDMEESLLNEIKTIEQMFSAIAVEKNSSYCAQKKEPRVPVKLYISEDVCGEDEDFRFMSVLPTLQDLQSDKIPFIREMKCEGRYSNIDSYLDTHFRLLREDFMQPLRNGISEYVVNRGQKRAIGKIREIRVYHNVRIIRPVYKDDQVCHMIKFDTSMLRNVNWMISRRLLYGSLLCLSNDSFTTVCFATVQERDIRDLNKGFLCVKFETIPKGKGRESFVMAESTAYFEAYKYVLWGLQSVDSQLPFQRYIIECFQQIKPPSYLLVGEVAFYDFSSILPSGKSTFTEVPVLNTARWPSKEDLDLDICQYDALKLALTKEMAIIQGPPGTGKTFIGLKIAQMLIANRRLWNSNEIRSPILVVCYTNHALDQFLEGILDLCTKRIVRIGGRCKTLTLEPYTLRNIKRSRMRRGEVSKKLSASKRVIDSCRRDISHKSLNIQKSFYEILTFCKLQEQMTKEQRLSFMQVYEEEIERNVMCEWLGLKQPIIPHKHVSIDLHNCAKEIWISHVLEMTDKMSESERNCITNIFSVSRQYDRARLYKTWVSEIEEKILKQRNSNRKRRGREERQRSVISFLNTIKTEIMFPKQMLQQTISPETRYQLTQFSKENAFEKWLCIDGSKESTVRIGCTLSNPLNYDRAYLNCADLEEERGLEGEDYSCLFDKNEKKPKQVETVDSTVQWIWELNAKEELNKLKHVLNSAEEISAQKVERISNVWCTGLPLRRNLYLYWVCKYRDMLKEEMQVLENKLKSLKDCHQETLNEETKDILVTADVIGMTTTGAAKHRNILQDVRPTILIVEEAAEVLESHIITAMSPGCKHLILIGDHKQLRPSTTVYELAKHYHLDLSLFERMVRNGVQCVTLSEQHRMRQEISALLRNKFLYSDLRDHKMVLEYESVRGIDSNVFFIEHNKSEVSTVDSTSHQNPHEAKFITELCRYLLKQEYKATQITVLTPYMGQISVLRREMTDSEFKGIRITAVDNFQGEENDIILLSLVRSKPNGQSPFKRNPIGFLSISNRICVSLSRAKIGMFVIGNFSLMKENSKLWHHIVSQMLKSDRVGTYLTLRCQNHPDNIIKAAMPGDFSAAPEGGCSEPCGAKLKCNHDCPKRVCHIVDREHKHIVCPKPCPEVFTKCGHKCVKRCGDECGQCEIVLDREIPKCGHTIRIECYRNLDPYLCSKICTVVLSCGHECKRRCGDCNLSSRHELKCKASVLRQLNCGHDKTLQCYEDPSVVQCKVLCLVILSCDHKTEILCFKDPAKVKCNELCNVKLSCDHTVELPCHMDPTKVKCKELCNVKLPCDHTIEIPCYKNSADIQCKELRNVKLSCGHSHDLPCFQDPAKIQCRTIRNIKLQCGHTFALPCYTDLSSVICSERCKAKLQCGHHCSGTCSSCLQGRVHQPCTADCEKRLPCGHRCDHKCSDFCPPCVQPCEWICSHGIQCTKRCSEPCRSCRMKCTFGCRHKTCTKLCYENCDDIRCDEKCNEKLKCGHACAGLCGEVCICSKFCNKKKSKQRYNFHKEDILIKIKPCGCIVSRRSLDKHMSQTVDLQAELVKRCPRCRVPLSSCNRRYANIMKLTSENILIRFREMIGNNQVTTQNIMSLDQSISSLERNGLGRHESVVLRQRLKYTSPASLYQIRKAIELLEKLCKISQNLKAEDPKIVAELTKMKRIIMIDRKHGSTQLWVEIRTEIKRLDYYVQLANFQGRRMCDSKGRIKEVIYHKAMEMLVEDKPLTFKRMSVIEKVIQKL